jgi:Tol biopolymer transport system component
MATHSINGEDSADQLADRKLNGDFILRVRLEAADASIDSHRKLGWRVSSVLDSDSAFVEVTVQDDGLTALLFRPTRGANTERVVLAIRGGEVLQLERRGKICIFSAAHFGEPFMSTARAEVDLGEDVNAKLFVQSQGPGEKETARFLDVRIIRPAKTGFRPYHDFIGASLEILDVYNGKLETVYRSAEPFEAPNWMLDGQTLIFNVSGSGANKGKLRTFDLTTRAVAPLDTAFAVHNNNDHVLSFDGLQLAISHHSPGDGGRSVIYALPSVGGTPRRITPHSPSYLHGWSPDSQWLVYTGGRKETIAETDKYDIYKIHISGGEEIRLTSSPGLSDGPEYSPDGRYIYFNSTRSGLVQLWRMKPDGSDQEQITNDEFNNWFPHVSPDGKWIVFLSFGQDVRPDDHPYYKHVYLRLMPLAGGRAKVIAYVYGGQGTINVPSWSPDSRRIAFVSNTDELSCDLDRGHHIATADGNKCS